MSIKEFLLARVGEDEQEAKRIDAEGDIGSSLIQHPDRLIAECAAKRAIIELADDVGVIDDALMIETQGWMWGTEDKILCALAAVYSDHPDYQKAWAA